MARFLFGLAWVLNYAASLAMPLALLAVQGKFLEPRPGKLWAICRYAACWVMCNNIIYIGDAFNILFALPVVFLLFRLGYRCAGAEWLSVSMLFYTLTTTLAALTDSALTFIEAGWGMLDVLDLIFDYAALVRGTVLLLVMLAVRRLLPQRRYALSARMWRLVGLLAVLPFVGILAAVTLVSPFYDLNLPTSIGTGMLPIFVLLPLFFLSALLLLYTAAVLAGQEQLEREAALARVSQAYYSQMEQQQQQVRRLRHDMANHLTALSGLLESGKQEEAEAYLAGLKAAPGVYAGRRYCDNAVVNTVLSAKAAAMEERGVQFTVQATVPEQVDVTGPDLCALLGNALDNAMEACARLPAQEREVRLTIRADRGLLALRVVNPCAREPQWEKGRLVSGKKDPENHGFGTESIRGIAEKYGGRADFTVKDGQFECMLYLPLA